MRKEHEAKCGESEGSRRIPITIAIPVRNEEANIARCLDALADRFFEIVVVDSASTDNTTKIASSYGARIVQFVWDGKFPKKRNWILQNLEILTPWILFLDADEIVTTNFVEEVKKEIQGEDFVGYWINYSNLFMGRELKHGVAQRKLALFRVGAGFYERIDEDHWSSLDMEVHEHPIIQGAIGEIHSKIRHEDDRGIRRFLDRHIEYAQWEARRLIALEQGTSWNVLTRRQLFKYRYIMKRWYFMAYFFYTYVIKLGFLDGAPGFYYALYKSWYFLTVRHLILELNAQSGSTAQIIRAG